MIFTYILFEYYLNITGSLEPLEQQISLSSQFYRKLFHVVFTYKPFEN